MCYLRFLKQYVVLDDKMMRRLSEAFMRVTRNLHRLIRNHVDNYPFRICAFHTWLYKLIGVDSSSLFYRLVICRIVCPCLCEGRNQRVPKHNTVWRINTDPNSHYRAISDELETRAPRAPEGKISSTTVPERSVLAKNAIRNKAHCLSPLIARRGFRGINSRRVIKQRLFARAGNTLWLKNNVSTRQSERRATLTLLCTSELNRARFTGCSVTFRSFFKRVPSPSARLPSQDSVVNERCFASSLCEVHY